MSAYPNIIWTPIHAVLSPREKIMATNTTIANALPKPNIKSPPI